MNWWMTAFPSTLADGFTGSLTPCLRPTRPNSIAFSSSQKVMLKSMDSGGTPSSVCSSVLTTSLKKGTGLPWATWSAMRSVSARLRFFLPPCWGLRPSCVKTPGFCEANDA
eukprot:2637698-Pyramimonas_sp.AAC.1